MRFPVVNDLGSLGARDIVAANVEKDYAEFDVVLPQGVTILGASAAISDGAASTIADGPTLLPNKKAIHWTVGAALEPETFTVFLHVVTNDGQLLQYSLRYTVIPLVGV